MYYGWKSRLFSKLLFSISSNYVKTNVPVGQPKGDSKTETAEQIFFFFFLICLVRLIWPFTIYIFLEDTFCLAWHIQRFYRSLLCACFNALNAKYSWFSLFEVQGNDSLIILQDIRTSTYPVRLETRRLLVQPPPRSATFFRVDWSWNIYYSHSLPSADSRRAVVSFWRKNVHNTG